MQRLCNLPYVRPLIVRGWLGGTASENMHSGTPLRFGMSGDHSRGGFVSLLLKTSLPSAKTSRMGVNSNDSCDTV